MKYLKYYLILYLIGLIINIMNSQSHNNISLTSNNNVIKIPYSDNPEESNISLYINLSDFINSY